MASFLSYLGCVAFLACALNLLVKGQVQAVDIHGGIQMGVSNNQCDNAEWRLEVDWDDSNDFEYQCQNGEDTILSSLKYQNLIECQPPDKQPRPIHHCMNETITYEDQPPRAGPHRPLWPVYGDYLYIPPQRWIHGLEHGAAVFLYHPCAEEDQVELFKQVAHNCIRRRIFTPYRNLPEGHPFAVITYGCRLLMSWVDVEEIVRYVKTYAINPKYASETKVYEHGQYDKALMEKARVVSDKYDSVLCPRRNFEDDDILDVLNGIK